MSNFGDHPAGFFGVSGFYNNVATQSLRFEDGSAHKLTRTFSGDPDNNKKMTISVWVKRGNLSTGGTQVIIATYGVASVGINIPRIFNLVLLEPGKSFVRVIQSIGRGIRKAEDKDFVQIWDVTSTCRFAKRHLTKRKAFYKEAQYPFKVEKINWS